MKSRPLHDRIVIRRLEGEVDALAAGASRLFQDIAEATRDEVGITRDAFGSRETRAGDLVAAFARHEGLNAFYDETGNLNVMLPSGGSSQQEILIGSHLDSVPRGGNYDGLAGVVAGVLILSAMRRMDIAPSHGLRVLGFRGEESPWYGTAYLGSKLFLGQLSAADLKSLRRFDTGLTLLQHLHGLGLPAVEQQVGKPQVPPERMRAYLELHIEQGPLLESLNRPLAVANAMRGNIRHPRARCCGAYAHSAAVPRHLRCDAVMATAKLLAFADAEWQRLIAAGEQDLVFTCGILQTNPAEHAMTKVPGEVTFSLNIGATRDATMVTLHDALCRRAAELAAEHRVRFDFGEQVGTPAVALDPQLMRAALDAGNVLAMPVETMATVGHDAAMFARAGVPTSVILVRSANGSHNPAESMDEADFLAATKVLATVVPRIDASSAA
jgi:beta-ureidopropionase / N-carbamoyl-L-amino-acid hydrolase